MLLFRFRKVVSDAFVTPWIVAHQASLSMGFPRQKYCSGRGQTCVSSFSFPGGSAVKNLPGNAGDTGLIPGSEDPLEEEMATLPVFLLGKSHGQRGLVGYCPWNCKGFRYNLMTEKQQYLDFSNFHSYRAEWLTVWGVDEG